MAKDIDRELSCIFVIFGGTGDLTKKNLFLLFLV